MSKEILIDIIKDIEIKLDILNLKEYLTKEELEKFYENIIPSLKKYDYKIEIEPFYNFAKIIGLNDLEVINFIKVYPTVLTKIGFDNFMKKYVFLSVVENETNTQRLRHIKKTPKDYLSSLALLYSKYFYMKENDLTANWSSLVRQRYEKIQKKIKNKNEDIKLLTIESIKEKYPVNDQYIEELRLLAINNFGVTNEKRRRK